MTEPTARQLRVLTAYIEGGGMQAAADRLDVPLYVIRDTLADLRVILRARNTAQAFALALQLGLIDPNELSIATAA